LEAELDWKSNQKRGIRYWKFIGLGFLVVILALVPLVVHSTYYMHLLIMAGINAMLAMTFILMLRTGLISLAIAAFWGLGSYASALLVMRIGLSFWLALPASTIIVGIIALGIGYIFVRNAGFGFLILTMVMGMLIVVVFGNTPLLGGYQGIARIPPPNAITIPFLAPIEFISKTPYYYLMLFLLLVVALAFWALYTAWAGRAWIAIGLNPRLAQSVGVNLFRYRLVAFVVASAAAALAGSFYASYIGNIIPGTFNVFKTIYVQIYAILGGVGFAILGPILGSLLMTFIPEFLRVTGNIEPMITGILLIILVLFLPSGLLGLLPSRGARRGESIARIGQVIKSLLVASRWR
jgi:branched-chain amino acid transport system permease protein